MTDCIQFGKRQIQYTLEYTQRKTLGITVTPEMEVLVKAPAHASPEEVKERVRKKALWIIKQQSYFLTFQPRTPERKFVSGETHLYLGRQYQLKIIQGSAEIVTIRGPHIEVITPDKRKARKLLTSWYLERARQKFHEIAQPLITRFRKYNVFPSAIVLRNMSRRWGSCTPGGKIILNPELIKAPRACIEYVITHELCHLVHRDHTKQFFDLQTKEMEHWEKWKMVLEKLLA